MDVLILLGRIMFAALFLNSAVAHFTRTRAMAGYAASRGVPASFAATVFGGMLLAAGGLSVLFGVWADLGALLLAVFLVPTALLMHGFWRDSAEARVSEQVQFFKDLALAGAALALAGLFATAGDKVAYTLTGPLF